MAHDPLDPGRDDTAPDPTGRDAGVASVARLSDATMAADLSHFTLATIRMQLTMATIGTRVPAEEQRLLGDWFDVLAEVMQDHVDRFEVGVAATTDLSEVAWRVAGPTERFLPAVLDACDFVGASRAGRIQLEEVGLQLAPATIGLSLQVGRAGIDAEWFVPERVDADDVAGLSLPAGLADLLVGEGRSVLALNGGLGASTYLGVVRRIEMSDAPVARQLAAQFEDAGVATPDAALLVAVSELHEGEFLRSDWFDPSGRVKLSVLADEPSTPTLLAASSASGGVADEVLADFVATLGATGARAVEVETWASGSRTRLLVDLRPG